jgi:NTP pyrophosphatase (non-canonical NTP hydrolase)
MNPSEYMKRTREYDNHLDDGDYRELAAALGLASEAGEVANEYERMLRIDGELNEEKVYYELGDVLWNVARLLDLNDWTFEQVMRDNIAKLEGRYEREGRPRLRNR